MKFTIILILFFSINIYSQDSLSYSYFDKKTYELYLAKDWKTLIETTKQAFNNGYDSYYFQMRIGIAYYERKNYVKATKHFEKARENNVNNTLREYLYYSYLFSGYQYKAEFYSQFFTDSLKKKLNIKPKFIKSVDLFGGSFINNEINKLHNLEFHNTDKSVSSSIRYKNEYNNIYGLGLSLNFSPNLKGYINYSYLNETKTQITKTNTIEDPSVAETKEYGNRTNQSTYYFNLKYLSNSFKLTTAFNLTKINDTYMEPYLDFGFKYKETNIKSTDIVFGLNMQQKISNFEIGIRGTYSNLNDNRQLLAELEAIYYPLGNKNLYFVASTGIQNIAEKTTSTFGRNNQQNISFSSKETNNISKLKIGFKTFKFLWVETQAYFGRINEYNEANSFIVYNDISPITSQYRINLIAPITKNLSVFIKYTYLIREQLFTNSKVIFLIPPAPSEPKIESETNSTKINNSSIIGGIKWTF